VRGVRVKALRGEFVEVHRRAPTGASIKRMPALGGVVKKGTPGKMTAEPRPWREVFKIAASRIVTTWTGNAAGGPKVRTRSVAEMFVRKIFGMEVVEPSEWRRWKKAYKRRQSGRFPCPN
jgi:hypothetical protein